MKIYIALLLLAPPLNCVAWEGQDTQTGTYVEIDKGNLVKSGQTIEIYDSNTGEYHDVDVQSVTGTYGGGAEVEVYDSHTGDYRTFEME